MSIFDTLKKGKELFIDAREAVGKFTSPVDSAEEINQQRLQSVMPSEVERIQKEQAMKQGVIKIGDKYVDPLFSGSMKKIVGGAVKNVAPVVSKFKLPSEMKSLYEQAKYSRTFDDFKLYITGNSGVQPSKSVEKGMKSLVFRDVFGKDLVTFWNYSKTGILPEGVVNPLVQNDFKTPTIAKPDIFNGFTDLSTHVLEKLKGVGDTSEKFIIDTMQNVKGKLGLKQPEQNIYTNALFDTVKNGKVNANDFANRVKQDLLPLKVNKIFGNAMLGGKESAKYEDVTLSEQSGLRGDVIGYAERIYDSPIKTSAGDVHFGSDATNYFGHTRIEDMADRSTRRVIEVQSDLFQKGRLEIEKKFHQDWLNKGVKDAENSLKDIETKLQPYKDIWHERLIREEVKKAAVDWKTKLQFPTGETAMKIEGLGGGVDNVWMDVNKNVDEAYATGDEVDLQIKYEDMKVGQEIKRLGQFGKWMVTDVLGDGKFKAVDKNIFENWGLFKDDKFDFGVNIGEIEYNGQKYFYNKETIIDVPTKESMDKFVESRAEQFDIYGRVDTSNPIYKFYESEVGKYLKKKYNATMKMDENGVTWWEINIDPSLAKQPVKAFGALPFLSGVKSLFTEKENQQTNEDNSTEL